MQLKETKPDNRKELMPALLDSLHQRRSVREFTGEAVTRAALENLVDAAIQAPSAMNEQPWFFTIITDKGLLSSIAKNAKGHALEAFAEGSHLDHIRERLCDPKFDIFYGAPALIVISAPKHSRWAIEDCAMAAENLMLAAHTMGLGTCWIGFSQDWLNTDEGRATVGLSESQLVVAPIIVGHPKSTPAIVSRRKPNIRWVG